MNILTHELAVSIFRYDPNTGAVYLIGKDTPITTKTKSGNAIRCQIQTADTYKDTTAHAVAWVLLSGQDLPKNHKPQHINGDTFDNRAQNLYLVIEAAKTNGPNYCTVVMVDNKLARYLYPNGRKTGDTWTCDAPMTLPIWHESNMLTVSNRAKPCYLGERYRIEKLPYDAPVDLDHFSAWIFANADPRTTEQQIADMRAQDTARELAEIEHPQHLWPLILETLIKQHAHKRDMSVFNTVLRWRNLHIKYGRTMHPLIEQCTSTQGAIDRWKEKQFVL